MRKAAAKTLRTLWIVSLALALSWTASAIHPHQLKHEADHNRIREALPPHPHQGVHFEAIPSPDLSPDCPSCLRSGGSGTVFSMAPGAAPVLTPQAVGILANEGAQPFRLAGRASPRAPPA